MSRKIYIIIAMVFTVVLSVSTFFIGRVYEYFLSKFALAEGKGKGEFYTPKCIVNLIAEMLDA